MNAFIASHLPTSLMDLINEYDVDDESNDTFENSRINLNWIDCVKRWWGKVHKLNFSVSVILEQFVTKES